MTADVYAWSPFCYQKMSSICNSSHVPVGLQADIVKVKTLGQHKWLSSQLANKSWAWAAWSITQTRFHETLQEYDQHKVLHFTDLGHVLLESHDCGTDHASHATYDHHKRPLRADQ